MSETKPQSYTAAEYRRFKTLVEGTERPGFDNAYRVIAGLDMRAFVRRVGRAKCDAMFAHLTGRDQRRSA